MTLPLRNLDDRTYKDLLDEARGLIPTLDPTWTNHNPSDPGITLIELFAWLTEMLIYRANRIPDQHLASFVRLLRGPDWQLAPDLAEEMRLSVVALRKHDRAVTCADYEALARAASVEVARARCIPRRRLDATDEADRLAPSPGSVSVIVVPTSGRQPSVELLQVVRDALEPRRLLTTRCHVVGPVYSPVTIEVLVARRADVPAAGLQVRITEALKGFLDPPSDGKNGDGWPFGRDVYVSEMFEMLERLSGVDGVIDVDLTSECPAGAERCVAAQELWHDNGDLIGLGLAAHHLPLVMVNPACVVAAAFVPVRVALQVAPAAGFAALQVRTAVKRAVKRSLHPLHGGPDGTADRTVTLADLRTLVIGLAEVATIALLELHSDPGHEQLDPSGQVVSVLVRAHEMVDPRVDVELME